MPIDTEDRQTANREESLLEELSSLRSTGYQFHWTVANRVPSNYGSIPFKPLIGINWLDGQNETAEGPVLYNLQEPSTWSNVSKRSECAQVVACVIVFDPNNKITDVLKAEPGKCLVNVTWTVAPKAMVDREFLGRRQGEIPPIELFELIRHEEPPE